jgi:tRNA nucleotidyltransferase/poly(A) polymerase
MENTLPSAVRKLADLFAQQGTEVRCVGGAVRDIVMDRKPKDWDMATPALPERTFQILEQIGKPFDLSNGHGTVSIILDDETYEITTLRVDAETDGRHAKVEFVNDWKLDAARRDFTFNAMSMDPLTGRLFDFFGGEQDIRDKMVRFVGVPAARIQEDYLRILRFFRFACRFDFDVAPTDLAAVIQNVAGLDKVSGERIWMEIKQIVVMERALDYIELMKAVGVWNQIVNRPVA